MRNKKLLYFISIKPLIEVHMSQTTNTVKKMALYLYTHSYSNLKKKVCTVPDYFPGMQDTVFLWSLSDKPTWILSSHLAEQKQDLINHPTRKKYTFVSESKLGPYTSTNVLW